MQPRTHSPHLRVDNASSSAAPVYFTRYLMLKATHNGFELCVFSHITLPPWKQLWQTAMKNPNRKLNYSNADSWLVTLLSLLFANNFATQVLPSVGQNETRELPSRVPLTNQWTLQGIYMLKGHNLTAIIWKMSLNLSLRLPPFFLSSWWAIINLLTEHKKNDHPPTLKSFSSPSIECTRKESEKGKQDIQ